MFCDAYRYTVNDVAPVFPDSGVSGLVEDDNNWDLGNFPRSRSAHVRMSVRADLAAIQTRCGKLSLAVPDKAVNIFGLALQVIGALQDSGDARARIAELKANEAEQLAKISSWNIYERKLLDANWCLHD